MSKRMPPASTESILKYDLDMTNYTNPPFGIRSTETGKQKQQTEVDKKRQGKIED
jgi:hypothetical protein